MGQIHIFTIPLLETMALLWLKILHTTKQKNTLPLRQTPDKLSQCLKYDEVTIKQNKNP